METVRAALDSAEFREGIRTAIPFGLLLLVVSLGWLVARRGRPEPLPFAGLAFAAAAVLALDEIEPLPDDVTRATMLAAAAGVLAGLVSLVRPTLILLGAVAAVPAALVVGDTEAVDAAPGWVLPLVLGVVVLGATLLADFDQRHRSTGWGPGLLALTVGGVWATVPDTEHVLVLLGVAVVVLAATVLFPLVSLGPIGAYPSVVILAWVIAIDGRGRPSSMIGAAGCLGLALVEPVARRLSPRRATVVDGWATVRWGLVPTLAVHAALVFVAARVAGMRDASRSAALLLAIALAGTLVVLMVVPVRSPRPPIPDSA